MLRQMIIDEIRQMVALDAATESDMETVADRVVDTVGKWLESDDVRPIIYDGLSSGGQTTKNVGAALAKAARDGDVHGT